MSLPAYTPVDAYDLDDEPLSRFLEWNPGVHSIRFQWLDYSNMLRCQVYTRRAVARLLNSKVGFSVQEGSLTMLEDEDGKPSLNLAEAMCQSPLIPDWHSLGLCPWAKGHAFVQCYLGKNNPEPQRKGIEKLYYEEMCPRFALRSAILEADSHDLEIEVGFGIQFCVTKRSKKGSSSTHPLGPYSPFTVDALEGRVGPVMGEIMECLTDVENEDDEEIDARVLTYYAGGQRDQYEIITRPLSPLEAVDGLIFTRQVIRNVCKKHSLVATFHPLVPATNGTHVNISLHDGKHLDTVHEESFLAGMIENLSATLAFTLPLPLSYHRTVAGQNVFGQFQLGRFQNKRMPTQKKGPALMDACANAYLAVAAMIVSGTAGVRDKRKLKDRKVLGIAHELPTCLEEAHSSLRENKVLKDGLGSRLVERYLQLMADFADTLEKVGDVDSVAQRDFLSTRL